MNRFLKLLMLVLIFGVLVGAVFAVGAFAEGEKATTVTYKIPEGNTDTFLLFDAKKGTFIRSSNNFIADSECLQDGVNLNDNILDKSKFENKPSASYYILMQDDYEVTTMWQKNDRGEYVKTAGHFNFFHLYANIVVDLGGHTMTFSTPLNAQTKGTDGTGLNFTFTNGNIVNNNTTKNKTYIFGFTVNNRNRSCHLTFDDVTFEVAQGTKPTFWVTSNSDSSTTKHLNLDITYKNCTFDTTNLTKTTYVSVLGATTENVTGNLEFIDCAVTGTHQSYFACRFYRTKSILLP